METARRLKYEPDPNKFDLRTHEWDAQGHLVRKNLYRSFIIEGRQYFERPVNSGNLWYENNQPAGRVELTFGENGKISSKTFDFNAPHKEFTPPLVGAEKLHYELEQQKEKNERLQAELDAIKKERESKEAKGQEGQKVEVKAQGQEVSASAPKLTKRGT